MQHTRETYFSVKPFFAHSLAATLAVVVLPVLVVYGLIAVSPELPMLLVATLGVFLSIGAMAGGAALWNSRIESTEISFSDLMLWRWFVRRRAEDTLEEGARLLGLDRSGQPVDDIRILPDQQLQVLKDLTAALESKDPYTHGHSQRVERHVYRTAAAMHLPIQDIEDLRKAAALHDVGKIRVPDRVLRKPTQLTIEERVLIEEHSVVGAWMVSSVGNADVIAAVRHHHERWDGTGYPDGLAGDAIPLFARIIAVADAYDAITSTRPYRTSAGRDDAVSVLRDEARTQFDPEVVEAFIAALPARLPVTAGLFLIVGGAPQRLFRAFASWLRRMGAGNLAPAVGAAGAAVVLGASVFTPNLPVQPIEEATTAAPAQSDDQVDALPKSVAKKDDPKEVKAASPRRRGQRGVVSNASRPDGTIVLADQLTRDPQGSDEGPVILRPEENEPIRRPAKPTPKPTPTSTPAPTPSPSESRDRDDDRDRDHRDDDDREEPDAEEEDDDEDDRSHNKNDGKDDCPNDGDAGGGNDWRCGAPDVDDTVGRDSDDDDDDDDDDGDKHANKHEDKDKDKDKGKGDDE